MAPFAATLYRVLIHRMNRTFQCEQAWNKNVCITYYATASQIIVLITNWNTEVTETEILNQLSEVYDRYWSINQWWASISFLIIAISHFASHRLNRFLIVIIIGLYSAFSIWLYRYLVYNEDLVRGFLQDLDQLRLSGIEISQAALNTLTLKDDASTLLFERIAQAGTFICSITYLIYSQSDISKKKHE